MTQKLPKIAAFIDALDLFFLPKEYKEKCYGIIAKDTELFTFAKSQFPKNRLLPISMHSQSGNLLSDKKILYSSRLISQLKKTHITHLVMPYQCTKMMHDWAKENNIFLIGTPYNQQKILENKVYFDKFLKINSLASPATLDQKNIIPSKDGYVAQFGISRGLEGTTFYQSRAKLVESIEKNKKRILIREYRKGISIGISIYIDSQKNYFFSAWRRQCFIYKNGYPDTFLGIQWLPTNFFTREMRLKIHKLLDRLAQALLKRDFLGIANIDLIISNNQPYILECNPRLSAASAQAFSVKNLNGYSDAYGFFLNTFLQLDNKHITPSNPRSSYKGSLLDIEIKGKGIIKNILSNGIYELKNDTIRFVGTDMELLNEGFRFLMTHELQKKGHYKHFTLCTIISHKPLYTFEPGTLNTEGQKIYNYFINKFLS